MTIDDGWDTPRARQEQHWARRQRQAKKLRKGSLILLGAVATVHVVQTMVNALV